MIDPTITEEVRALEALDLAGLRMGWRRRYGPPPKLRSVELLRLSLAWRIQSQALGGLDAAMRRRLRGGGGIGRTDPVGPGVRITREWRGEVFEIERTGTGYIWRDERYRSLSAVATAITGAKRNGPKFFGLREDAAAS